MVTNVSGFRQLLAKMAFFLKTNVMLLFSAQMAVR
jgi:hypothetical protein